jgi:hypothetical protein
MKEKYADQYIEELEMYFPEIEKKELLRMVKSLTGQLSSYMRVWYRGFTIRSTKSLLEDGKLNRFVVARIFGTLHLKNMRKAGKKVKENKDVKRK